MCYKNNNLSYYIKLCQNSKQNLSKKNTPQKHININHFFAQKKQFDSQNQTAFCHIILLRTSDMALAVILPALIASVIVFPFVPISIITDAFDVC